VSIRGTLSKGLPPSDDYSKTSVDDYFLERATSKIPKRSIILVEDIDCAFPSREDDDDDESMEYHMDGMGSQMPPRAMKQRSKVTLSGFLNLIDGVGSDQGRIFFATVGSFIAVN
jgi:mitochondrial chaperone BCS1